MLHSYHRRCQSMEIFIVVIVRFEFASEWLKWIEINSESISSENIVEIASNAHCLCSYKRPPVDTWPFTSRYLPALWGDEWRFSTAAKTALEEVYDGSRLQPSSGAVQLPKFPWDWQLLYSQAVSTWTTLPHDFYWEGYHLNVVLWGSGDLVRIENTKLMNEHWLMSSGAQRSAPLHGQWLSSSRLITNVCLPAIG